MAIGSEPEIGMEFTVWGKMTEKAKEAWMAHLKGMRDRGNILEGYANVHYPKNRGVTTPDE